MVGRTQIQSRGCELRQCMCCQVRQLRWLPCVFPGKGRGPGFSLSGRPSAFDRTLILRARRIFCMHFYGFSEDEVTFACIFTGLMGMSCFLVQNCTRITKVSCFSVHFCSQLSPILCVVRFFACFVHPCVILCLCATVCGRQFLSRVDIFMQFHGVFEEPFMGMSYFLLKRGCAS